MSAQPNPFAPHWLIRDIVVGSHMAAAGPGGLLFIGDSIVEGFYWSHIGSYPVVNAGYCGIWAEALLPKVPRLLETAKPRLAVLLVGTNDAKKDRTDQERDEAVACCDRIIQLSEASSVPFVVMTPPPVEAGKRLTSFYSADAMAGLSRRIVQAAERRGAEFIDLHSALSGDGPEAQSGVTTDGVHLSPRAYRLLHDMLQRKVADMTDGAWED